MSENIEEGSFEEIDDDLFENEEFELLCNQAEADQLKEDRKKEQEKMNKEMDAKLSKIKAQKEQAHEEKLVQQVSESNETFSGLILRKGGRMMKQDDVEILVKNRKFIPLEEIDSTVDKTGISSIKAYFTIGVVVEMSKPITAKSGKQFLVMKLSDLVKYDITKAKKQLQVLYKEDQETLKMAEKSMNSNGYKCMKIMIFGDLTAKFHKLQIGTVIGLLNPKCMKPTVENGFAYTIDLEAQLFKIGFSEDFALCKGVNKQVNTTGSFSIDQRQCTQFVNKSVETMCDSHKFISKQNQLQKIRSQRIGLQSDYVDINIIKKQQLFQDQQQKIGAFGKAYNKNVQPKLSPKTKERLQKQNQKEHEDYHSYINERSERGKKLIGKPLIQNLQCSERSHLINRPLPKIPTLDISKPLPVDDEDNGLEFIGGPPKQQDGQQSSIRNLLLNGKMTFEQRFGKPENNESANLKRTKLQ